MDRPSREVNVWWANPNSMTAGLRAYLSADELARARGFQRETDRRQYTLAVTMLRRACADQLGVPPQAVLVDRTCKRCGSPHGKPRIPGSNLHVSITHTEGLVGLALTTEVSVGIDAELIRPIDWVSMLGQILTPNEPRPNSTSEFYTCWTRKESVVKATGDGLFRRLTEVQVPPKAMCGTPVIYGGSSLTATVLDLDVGPRHVAALTVLGDAGFAVVIHNGLPTVRDGPDV